MCYWGVMYPIDYIKTQMQTDNLGNRKYKGLWDTFIQKKQDGIRSFYKGFHVCMLRAFPVNAGGFFIF
jgi:solute carrier family 25 carnitine/acylcarnitine transporter 20/29